MIIASLLMHLFHLAALGSHLLFSFHPNSLACFYVCDGASSTSTFCTRPQALVPKPRTFPEHQLWFTASKSHFYADVSQINIFSPDRLSWTVFTWVSEKSQTQHVWGAQYFLANCYTQLSRSNLVVPPVFPGLPWWLRGLNVCLHCGKPRFNPWVGKILWWRKWQPTQYSCLENPMDRGAWEAAVHRVRKSWTWLSNFTFRPHRLKSSLGYYSTLCRKPCWSCVETTRAWAALPPLFC